MLHDIVEATALDGHVLRLRFDDGVTGTVDVAKLVSFTGVFAPLKEQREFQSVRIDEELATVVWPCGADLDPDVLYSVVSGKPIPNLERIGNP